MDAIASFPISVLLEKVEAVYRTLLERTLESETEGSDTDLQIAIQEIRQEQINQAGLILKEIDRKLLIAKESDLLIQEDDLMNKKKRLLQIIDQIHQIDKKKTMLIEEERTALNDSVQSLRASERAVTQYQKTISTEI